VWFCQFAAGKVARLDPSTGEISELSVGRDTRPRRMAAAPDGSLWAALYRGGKLVRIDPEANEIAREYDLPAGTAARPYAVAIDSAGNIYASATGTNRIVRLDPRRGTFDVFPLPGGNAMVRGMAADVKGPLWYVGSASGRLGLLE
jgi:virginiamycin B lyase